MAFPINGMAPGLAVAPGHGQVALGANKVARGPHRAPQVQRPTPMGWGGVGGESPIVKAMQPSETFNGIVDRLAKSA